MSIPIPGFGSVPVKWYPASDEDYKDKSEGGRSGYQPVAIVHHRGVTTLSGLDRIFAGGDTNPATVGSSGRAVAATFGIGHLNGKLEIHQYVDLSDTAYCNGDCRAVNFPSQPSRWDKWYGHKGHNERTVSIEHEDNGGSSDPTKKGIVTEDIIRASIALDRLMLSGDLAAIRAAGIHCRDAATATALGRVNPGPTTLLDHNDIAGANKPYCWRPWKADKIGFPRARYIAEISATAQEDDVIAITDETPALLSMAVGKFIYNTNGTKWTDLKTAIVDRLSPYGSTIGGVAFRVVRATRDGTKYIFLVRTADVTLKPMSGYTAAELTAAKKAGAAEVAAAASLAASQIV